MQLSNYFSISRFWMLVKLELFKNRKGILMIFVITFGLLFFIGLLLTGLFEPNLMVYEHTGSYAFALLTGGFIISSLSYNDLSTTLRKYYYLTLPVSTLERFFCMWLLTSIGWIILFTIIYTLYTLLTNLIGPLIFSQIKFVAFKPWNESALITMKYYFVLQGIFMVGAAKFKGYVLPKTIFTLVLFSFVCGFVMYFLMADLFELDTGYFENPEFLVGMPIHRFWLVIQWVFWWVLPLLCWTITYLSLKEKEV